MFLFQLTITLKSYMFVLELYIGKDPSDSGAVATMDRHKEELMNLKLAEEKNGLENGGMESSVGVGKCF